MRKEWPLDTAVSFDPYYGEPDRDGDTGYELLPDGKVFVRVRAPAAGQVVIDRFGTEFPLERASEGMWEGTLGMGTGFLYFFLKIDGADVLSHAFPIGYGCCRPMNFVDVPVEHVLRVIFGQDVVEAGKTLMGQVFHVAVAAARRVGQQYVEIGFRIPGSAGCGRSYEVFYRCGQPAFPYQSLCFPDARTHLAFSIHIRCMLLITHRSAESEYAYLPP